MGSMLLTLKEFYEYLLSMWNIHEGDPFSLPNHGGPNHLLRVIFPMIATKVEDVKITMQTIMVTWASWGCRHFVRALCGRMPWCLSFWPRGKELTAASGIGPSGVANLWLQFSMVTHVFPVSMLRHLGHRQRGKKAGWQPDPVPRAVHTTVRPVASVKSRVCRRYPGLTTNVMGERKWISKVGRILAY